MNNKIIAGAAKVCVTPTPDYFPLFNKKNFIGGGPDSIFKCAHDDVYL